MTTVRCARMPCGSENGGLEWMNDLPARYVHGRKGFDRRIMEEPSYTSTTSQTARAPSHKASRSSWTG